MLQQILTFQLGISKLSNERLYLFSGLFYLASFLDMFW